MDKEIEEDIESPLGQMMNDFAVVEDTVEEEPEEEPEEPEEEVEDSEDKPRKPKSERKPRKLKR